MVDFGIPDSHFCTSRREGQWVIWICPYCSDPGNDLYTGYERRFNLYTGEMIVKGYENNHFLHQGCSSPESTVSEELIQNINNLKN